MPGHAPMQRRRPGATLRALANRCGCQLQLGQPCPAAQEVEETIGAAGLGPRLRRSIRQYYALAWEPPQRECCTCCLGLLPPALLLCGQLAPRSGALLGMPRLRSLLTPAPAGGSAPLPQLFGELPLALRHRLAVQQLRPVLDELHVFPAAMPARAAAACCKLLAAAAHPLVLAPGHPLEAPAAPGGGAGGGGSAAVELPAALYILSEGGFGSGLLEYAGFS